MTPFNLKFFYFIFLFIKKSIGNLLIIIVLLRDKFLCSLISTLYLWLKPVKIVEHMDGTLAMTKKNILNTFKKLHKQLYKKFLMQYA